MPSNLEVVYLDDDLIVVEKPPGLLSIPDGYDPNLPNLLQLLSPDFGKLFTIHRLDKETSGVILFARNSAAHRSLNLQFQNRETQKIYLAWVEGIPAWSIQTIDIPLRINADRKHRTLPDPLRGTSALTLFNVIEKNEGNTLLAVMPKTGYTHQIRAHLAAIQHPILFDRLYNPKYKPILNGSSKVPERRLMLHAYSLQFVHPTSLASVSFSCPIPDDFILPHPYWQNRSFNWNKK